MSKLETAHSTDVAQFLRLLHPDGQVFEVRSIKCPERLGGSYCSTASGCFNDADIAAKEIERLERVKPPAVYVTLNPINPALIGRAANRVVFKADKTSLDADIVSRRFLLVDIDAIRPSGISSTDAELVEAERVSDALLKGMSQRGWPEPLQGMSGNGRYLLWRIELPNDEDSKNLLKSVLQKMAVEFNTDGAEIDLTMFNASRIAKVLGTVARKGDEVLGVAGIDDRPHRQSWFIAPESPLEVVAVELLREYAETNDEEPRQSDSTENLIGHIVKAGEAGESKDVRKAKKYLSKMSPSISGDGGAKKLFAAACKAIHKFGLSDSETLAVLESSFNPRCEPPWDTPGLERAIQKARQDGSPESDDSEHNGALSDHPPETVAWDFLGSQLREDILTLRNWAGTYWKWLNGRYVELTKEDVRNNLVRELQKTYSDIKTQDVNHVLMNVAANCSVMSCLSMPRWLEGGDEIARTWQPEDTLATRRQIIHLPSLVSGSDVYSVPATPAYFNAVATDYDFAVDAPPPTRWLSFIDELFGKDEEAKELLRQWLGYCLTADTRQQKIMLMVGPKRSGKGTIASVMRSLVGDGNCCAPTLSGLATNFGLQALLGKTLAIIGDARLSGRTDVAATTERLLSISGEDATTVDRKHKEPVTTQLRTRFTIISNELPRLNDASGALAGRLVILRFTKSFFGKEDKTLRAALHDERQSILLWAIGGWASLRERGRFVEPASSRDLVEQMADIASPITAFVSDRCEIADLAETHLSLLYESFREWSVSNGIEKPVSLPVFSRDLTAAYPELTRSRTRSGSGPDNKARTIKGIRLGGR